MRHQLSGITNRVSLILVFALILRFAASQQMPACWAQPNIVFILADDLGYGDVGCFNPESKIPTPNMDRLAREGVRFTDAHSADSVCTPSRYAVMTGRYCWRTRLQRTVLFNYEPPLIEAGRTTVASLLHQSGYATAMVGKWHLGLGFTARDGKQVDFSRPLPWYSGPEPDREVSQSIDFSAPVDGGPIDLGFDEAFFTAGCSTDQEPFCFIENKTFLGMDNASYRQPAGSWRSGMAAPEWVNETVDVNFTNRAVNFIRRSHQRDPEQPFFLYVALSAPHSPHLVPGFAKGKSQAGVRGDMVWLVDWCVGRIANALDNLDLSQKTLLIVTSDNGPLKGSLEPGAPERTATISNGHKSAGDLRGYKGRVFEGGHRVPFIAKWPNHVPVASIAHEPVCLVDLLATVAEIVGAKLPDNAGEDSMSMLPVLQGINTTEPLRESMIHHSGNGSFALRKGQWKIIFGQGQDRVHPVSGPGYLYNLREDPYEARDLWSKYPQVVADLTRLMEKQKTIGRSVPLPNPRGDVNN